MAVAIAAGASNATAQSMSLVDLGAGASAYGVNASGQVTGCAPAMGGAQQAFIYTSGTFTGLGTLGGVTSCGYAINVSGQVTGYADTASASHAFLYSNGSITDLGTVGGAASSAGVSINDNGDVVGYAWEYGEPFAPLQAQGLYPGAQLVSLDVSPPTANAFLYSQGAMTSLFPSPPGPFSKNFALAINNAGEIGIARIYGCGILCPYGGAYVVSGGVSTQLTDLPGNDGTVFLTVITGINASGQIAAYGMDPLAYMHGVVYTNGVPVDLGNNTEARAINSNGDVVGFRLGNSAIGLYNSIGNDMTPIVYTNGAVRDLNLPGLIPSGINDSGWIIGNHLTLNHAYVLQPSTISLAPVGLSFGSVIVGQTSPYSCGSCQVTLTNNTAGALSVSGVSVAGPFVQTNNCPGSLSPGASCVFSMSFNSNTAQTSLGALSVNAGGTYYATLLTGTATITAEITSSVTTVQAGTPFTLTWSATPNSTCMAQGDTQFYGPIAVSGSKTINEPSPETETFAMTCTQGSESAQAQVTVTVKAASGPGGGSANGGGGGLDLFSLVALFALLGRHRLTAHYST